MIFLKGGFPIMQQKTSKLSLTQETIRSLTEEGKRGAFETGTCLISICIHENTCVVPPDAMGR
jgi:hypothetical protein